MGALGKFGELSESYSYAFFVLSKLPVCIQNSIYVREPNLETAESIVAGVAKNNCSGGELWLSPINVKGLNIRKPKTQLLQ